MFVDSNTITQGRTIETDVCIVGAGAAGLVMAQEFNDSGHSVCILESGDFERDSETQALYDLESTDLPISSDSRFRVFGGTTTEWAGRWKPHDPLDFDDRPWVPRSGWPIEYSDLIAYYQRAARAVGAPDVDLLNLETLGSAVAKSTYPLIHNDILETTLFQWLKEKDWNWGIKFRSMAEQSKNVTVYLRANVVRLETSPNESHLEQVQVKTLSGNTFSIRARHVVLACGGIENARLLLASGNSQSAGIGNQHDQVGRYYMDHPKGVVGEIVPYNKRLYLPVYWGADDELGRRRAGIRMSCATQEKHHILNSYVLFEPVFPWGYNPGISAAVNLAKLIKQRDIPSDIVIQHVKSLVRNQTTVLHWVGSKFFEKAFKRQASISRIKLWNFMEQSPRPENRVQLTDHLDALGMRKARVTWTIDEQEKHTMRVMHRLLKEEVERMKLGTFTSPLLDDADGDWPIDRDASHHMGTTRMGTDPTDSVVNTDCRIHTVDNLFVAGSSVFPTSGYSNPTCTISALAIRLSDHLKNIL